MIDKIESKFSLRLPTDEKKFFQLLIKNITSDIVTDNSSKAALYILAHGNTASSIAEVCNRLLHTDFVKAFDMPLTQDVNQSYQLFVEEIESLQMCIRDSLQLIIQLQNTAGGPRHFYCRHIISYIILYRL